MSLSRFFLFLRCSGRKKQEAADESLSSENRSQPSAAFSHRVCSWKYPPRAAEHVQTAPITDNTNFNSAPTTQTLTSSGPARKLSICKICKATSFLKKIREKKGGTTKTEMGGICYPIALSTLFIVGKSWLSLWKLAWICLLGFKR